MISLKIILCNLDTAGVGEFCNENNPNQKCLFFVFQINPMGAHKDMGWGKDEGRVTPKCLFYFVFVPMLNVTIEGIKG